MKYTLIGLLFLFFAYTVHPASTVYASQERAYQDYLYQFDVYRQKNNEFQIARNEYLKFKSLASETQAIVKTREMLSQRSILLKTYLLLLNETVNGTPSMEERDRMLYMESITKENGFLDTHSQFVNSVSTLEDAAKANKQLEDRYVIMQTSMRQIILGIQLARLRVLLDDYTIRMMEARMLIDEAKKELTLERHSILDRWYLQIANKRTLYLQKQDQITQTISGLKDQNIEGLNTKYTQTLNSIVQAQQDLREGNSFMIELANAMKYKD